MRIKNTLLWSCTLLIAVSQSAFAQTAPLAEKQRAVLAFEIDVDRFLASPLAQLPALSQGIQGFQQGAGGDNFDIKNVSKISGFASAPEGLAAFQRSSDSDTPVEFFVQIHFKSESAIKEMLADLAEKSTTYEEGGRTYYRPNNPNGPQNIRGFQADALTLVTATTNYLGLSSPKQAFTSNLSSAWSHIGSQDDAVRIAVDLHGARDLINQAVDQAKGNADAMGQAFLDLVPGITDVRLTLDFSGKNLLTFGSTCSSEDNATQLNDALDSILGMAKMAGGMQLGQFKQQAELAGIAKVGEQILDALSPKQNGTQVTVTIPRPEGFEAALQQIGAMMPGGPGPGGFDDDDF